MSDQLTGIQRQRAVRVALNEVLRVSLYAVRPSMPVDIVAAVYNHNVPKAMDAATRHMFVYGVPAGYEEQAEMIREAAKDLDKVGYL